MPRYLIVNADDFGRSPGVNRGIIKAYREGIVSSTSVMTNQPYFEEAASLLRDHPSLGAGVHLVFTAWKPVLPPEKIPSLVDEKGFFLPQELGRKKGSDFLHGGEAAVQQNSLKKPF